MLSPGLGDPREAALPEPPPLASMEAALKALRQHGAITGPIKGEVLTPLGRLLSNLPVEVHLGKLLIYGGLLGLEEASLTVAAGLAVQSPFKPNGPHGPRDDGGRQDAFDSPHGDPFTLMRNLELSLSRILNLES